MHTSQCLREAAQKCRRLASGISNPDVVDLLQKSAINYELRAIEIERNSLADAPPQDSEK